MTTALVVSHSGELQRILDLPRRVWTAEDLASLALELTAILRVPPGGRPCRQTDGDRGARARLGLCPDCGQPLTLKPAQALGLHDAGVERGLFGPIAVGNGKTLLSLLLPVVLDAKRPLLLLPGGLIEKTVRERELLSFHWRIPTAIRVMSYDILGRVEQATELHSYAPDLIVADEVHRLKNKRAAVTRRVARYMTDRPETSFCGLSGTVMDKSIKDFAHIACWCLKWGAPVPTGAEEIEEWAEALDEGTSPFDRRQPGALLTLCSPEELAAYPAWIAARHGFRRRLTETPGVVATIGDGESVGCSIYVRGILQKVSKKVEAHFLKLRTEWATPDDWELTSGVDVWRHAQELALGLYYAWDPRPPLDWMLARSAWGRFVRATIGHSRTYDSELHVAQACDAGKLPDGVEVLRRWRELESTFLLNVVARWEDDHALNACREWSAKPGIIWTEHDLFARRLSEVAGLPYYGAGGFTATGEYIEDAPAGSAVIASIDANREGKNLQRLWSRNLMVCPPTSAAWWEQVIARTHRTGQAADEVTFDVLLGCRENFDACMRALAGAQAIQDVTGKRQKLTMATVDLPGELEIEAMKSPRWQR